jgi:hypothetical protein
VVKPFTRSSYSIRRQITSDDLRQLRTESDERRAKQLAHVLGAFGLQVLRAAGVAERPIGRLGVPPVVTVSATDLL